MHPQQFYGGGYPYYSMPYYNYFCPQPLYPTFNNMWQYYGSQYLPNVTPNHFIGNRPQAVKSVPPKKKCPDLVELVGWRQKQICCGTIFVGPKGQILLNPKYIHSHVGKCKYRTICDSIYPKPDLSRNTDDETDHDSGLLTSNTSQTESDSDSGRRSHESTLRVKNGSTKTRSTRSSNLSTRSSIRSLRARDKTYINWDFDSSEDSK